MNQTIQRELEKIYSTFFQIMKINSETGIIENTTKRFATKPAIGNSYGNSTKRVLFVSLDIGRDELFVEGGINIYQDYNYRKSSVCSNQIKGRNPHMAGIYGISLYLLKETYNWRKEWDLLEESNKFFKDALNENCDLLPENVLSNISLINFYNFVEVGRTKKK